MGKGKDKDQPRQLGVKIDPMLWKELRMLALQQDTTATDLLERAIKEYVTNHRVRTK